MFKIFANVYVGEGPDVHQGSVCNFLQPCVDPESLVRGGLTLTTFFFLLV